MAVESSMERSNRLKLALHVAILMSEAGKMRSVTQEELKKYWPKDVPHYDLLIGDFGIDDLNDPNKMPNGN